MVPIRLATATDRIELAGKGDDGVTPDQDIRPAPMAARVNAAIADRGPRKNKSPLAPWNQRAFLTNTPGSDLLSHALTHAVPSAVEGLTSVFGMGTGVTPLL